MLDRQNSVISILSSGADFCRICHCDGSCGELISPCFCSGSLRWVHQNCLQRWIRASNSKSCELCRYPFSMRTKLRAPCDWEALPMSPSEKRRHFCSAIFHTIALGCVIWSLSVLIDRTIEELYTDLDWQFWTKVVVEFIGCVGAGILFYVWGRIYFGLLSKWIAFNRTFVIVNSAPVPVKQKPSSCTNLSLLVPSHSSPGCGGGGGPEGGDCASPSTMGGQGTILSDKEANLEARALLLPPVVYEPPDSTIGPQLNP